MGQSAEYRHKVAGVSRAGASRATLEGRRPEGGYLFMVAH